MSLRADDERFIDLALDLARAGVGRTSPNPAVGALIVKDGAVIGRGSHARAGSAHAERIAISSARRSCGRGATDGATLYVTLEPCAHHGKTPPCVDAIVEARISRVMIGAPDLSPKEGLRGATILGEKGIRVEFVKGRARRAALALVADFHKFTRKARPWVLLKSAISIDGKIATPAGSSKWITSVAARRRAHQFRARSDAVVVGSGTALIDDPELTARHGRARPDLMRVVIDSSLAISPRSRLAQSAREFPLTIFCARSAEARKEKVFKRLGALIERVGSSRGGRLDLDQVLARLAELGVMRAMVEGGARLAGSFLDRRLVDEAAFFIAPKILGGRSKSAFENRAARSPEKAIVLSDREVEILGPDILLTGRVRYPSIESKH